MPYTKKVDPKGVPIQYKQWQEWQGNEGEFDAANMKALVTETRNTATGLPIDPSKPLPPDVNPEDVVNYPLHLSVEIANMTSVKTTDLIDEIESKGIGRFLQNKKPPETAPKYDMSPEDQTVFVKKCVESPPCSLIDKTSTPTYKPPPTPPPTRYRRRRRRMEE